MTEIAEKVLDYWFAVEFLTQDSYEVATDESKIKQELKRYSTSSDEEKEKRKQIRIFNTLGSQDNIYDIVLDYAKRCNMSTWGNLTYYIGRVRRQACIERIAKALNFDLKQPEKSIEYIPVLSFQCSCNGTYIEHSLSLSPIVWAVSQITSRNVENISNVLSGKAYDKYMDDLEMQFFRKDEILKEVEKEYGNKEGIDDTPVFAPDAIQVSTINKIYSDLKTLFEDCLGMGIIEQKNALLYHLFKDEKAKEKYDDDNYSGLSNDFFSSDLQMVRDYFGKKKEQLKDGMLSDLLSYICAPYHTAEKGEHYDLIHDIHKEYFFEFISKIMDIRNTPKGKWPSRYMPAFMQQMAVNFVTSKEEEKWLDKFGQIFSVNGPPGTGKTTLLKEIVVNHVVEKARILSECPNPDDAFMKVPFKKGNYGGAYTSPNTDRWNHFDGWYKFKDDRITDYGILVASCNNAAVENITKELPIEKELLKNLNVGGCTEMMRKSLEDISGLFSVEKTKERIIEYKKDKKKEENQPNTIPVEIPDIFFTEYASQMLSDDQNKIKAWGLIAAPLGKKKNISEYYFSVVKNIVSNVAKDDERRSHYIDSYNRAKSDFDQQYTTVCRLKKLLSVNSSIMLDARNAKMTAERIKVENEEEIKNRHREIRAIEQTIQAEEEKLKECCAKLEEHRDVYKKANDEIKGVEEEKERYSAEILSNREKAKYELHSVSFLTKLFFKKKYQATLAVAEFYENKAAEHEDKYSELEAVLGRKYVHIQEIRDAISKYENEQSSVTASINEKNSRISDISESIAILKKQVESAEEEARKHEKAYTDMQKKCEDADDLHKFCVIDEPFVSDLQNKKSQLKNPWTTEEYNRERERLFYYALQFTKYFLLRSECCRTNLCILGQYWGLYGNEKITFHADESNAMLESLFNTMFLLTPVVSSTFASVGRLLRDMKAPGSIGTLIIDEAGQAQPQMAVGALFRSRRAIIVGDPKQVEPVVTDDLDILKNAYKDPVLENYKDKSLSVQVCADIINPFGTYFETGTHLKEWVGCPLLVHRRCISPMYNISNLISYNGIMLQQTADPPKARSFLWKESLWIQVKGIERDNKDHYIAEQGELVCELVKTALQSSEWPDLYIISPFKSVVRGVEDALRRYKNSNPESNISSRKLPDEWMESNIGTVHRFQGKEADEVIFVLGCDLSKKDSYAVKGFVNSNIVNVAATRARYRLYIVGDINVWKNNPYLEKAAEIIGKTVTPEDIGK